MIGGREKPRILIGVRVLNTGMAPWPSYTEDEVAVVSRVLLSNRVNYWTGDEGRQFEREFAAYVGCSHAIALANGTVALDVALKCLGVGAGAEVIVTSRTFLASVSSIVTAGATPVFADVDRNTQNITAATIAAVLTPATKAIICVHLAGWPCDMDPIMELARAHNLFVIEDCAQAHGAQYKGRHVGTIGHVGAWSFCQDKIMTTGGEGGLVTTNDAALWSAMWSYKDHGKSWHAVYEKTHPPGFRWVHDSFGTNWRMLEVQAVLGRMQLQRMAHWSAARRANAARMMPWRLVFPVSACQSCRLTSSMLVTNTICLYSRSALPTAGRVTASSTSWSRQVFPVIKVVVLRCTWKKLLMTHHGVPPRACRWRKHWAPLV